VTSEIVYEPESFVDPDLIAFYDKLESFEKWAAFT
jgi:hypothetical protein